MIKCISETEKKKSNNLSGRSLPEKRVRQEKTHLFTKQQCSGISRVQAAWAATAMVRTTSPSPVPPVTTCHLHIINNFLKGSLLQLLTLPLLRLFLSKSEFYNFKGKEDYVTLLKSIQNLPQPAPFT